MNETLRRLVPHPSKSISDRIAGNPKVINLTLGEVDFLPPDGLHAACGDLLMSKLDLVLHRYTSSRGLPALGAAIAARYNQRYGSAIDPERHILVTSGAAQALWLSIFAVTNPGDEILLPDPCYMLYEPIATSLGRVPVRIPTSPKDGYTLSLDAIDVAATPRTRLLIVNSPANPTGAVYSRDHLEQIGQWAIEAGILVVHDEVFDHFVYAGTHISLASLFPDSGHVIAVNSLSKTFGMTGWRIGWMIGPPEFIALASTTHGYQCLALPTLLQLAAARLLEHDDGAFSRAHEERFRQKSERCMRALLEIAGFACPAGPPAGGFYAFVDVRDFFAAQDLPASPTGSISEVVASALLDRCSVAVVPGNAFGPAGEGFIRLSFAGDEAAFLEAVRRIRITFPA